MADVTLHLMTQRDQPYGSERRCCELCGVMLVGRPDAFWQKNTWTDDPSAYRPWAKGTANVPDDALAPCTPWAAAKSPEQRQQAQGEQHG